MRLGFVERELGFVGAGLGFAERALGIAGPVLDFARAVLGFRAAGRSERVEEDALLLRPLAGLEDFFGICFSRVKPRRYQNAAGE